MSNLIRQDKISLVITSIASDESEILKKYSVHCNSLGVNFVVIGDSKSPSAFKLPSCNFLSIEEQYKLPFKIATLCPLNHYARKNIGYLYSMTQGSKIILETDDDNIPYDSFWDIPNPNQMSYSIKNESWLNVYRYFNTQDFSWPRGFPLTELRKPLKNMAMFNQTINYCPIQQGLANQNPDVDAIYRLIGNLPLNFSEKISLALGTNTWCPFNSQNTIWFKDAFPLLYLPAYCSFRMTDIWRSFVAQRIAWENDWNILFFPPSVYQERNIHNLLKDFSEEIPGYLHNQKICSSLESLTLKRGKEHIPQNLLLCYELLVSLEVVDQEELNLVEAWNDDFAMTQAQS